jgi:hypothetical protein
MNKLEAQNIHAVNRAKERYDLELSVDDLKQIANKIRKGKSRFVAAETLRITKHLVEHKGVVLLVVYEKNMNSVCSFLLQE